MIIIIGIGKWQGEIRTAFFSAKGVVEIRDNNGNYEFIFELPNKYKNTEIIYHEIKEISNDTLLIKAEASLFPKKTAVIKITFKGNKLFGVIYAPIMGGITLKIQNGKRIE